MSIYRTFETGCKICTTVQTFFTDPVKSLAGVSSVHENERDSPVSKDYTPNR
jgi:hypothetical protein